MPIQPQTNIHISLLSSEKCDEFIEHALFVLRKTGIKTANEQAITLLLDSGAIRNPSTNRICIPESLSEKCLASIPHTFTMFDRDGEQPHVVGDKQIYFNPGSSALYIYDIKTRRHRSAQTNDLIRLAALTDQLPAIAWQSTALVPDDVPKEIADRYRLFLALQYSRKPIVTGTFSTDGFSVMHELLCAIRGGQARLADKPLAIFDCCPTSPLSWSELTCQNLIDCAHTSVPATIVPMPLMGATAPGFHAGFLVQIAAEIISGLVIHQLARPGAPVCWGGSPAVFDMRHGTTPVGTIESMMLNLASCQLGYHLRIPTMGYLGLSDAATPDIRAGFESGTGATLAALGYVNIASGPGMFHFQSSQCLEKLVIDNDLCEMVLKLRDGIPSTDLNPVTDLLDDIDDPQHFLTSFNTMTAMRSEFLMPSSLINRTPHRIDTPFTADDILLRSHQKVNELIPATLSSKFDASLQKELQQRMLSDAQKYGTDKLPIINL
ncbi:trimethylamine methyltransferase family protein [candidate division KSB1 bacterium]|nr:trimethylamine methyltransferase family protein [candidate division KSB1 bacterium]